MRRLTVFNSISLDGYFTDAHGDMSWAHRGQDDEWAAFINDNASGGGELVFGRVTYELMASYWPTPEARAAMPVVAERMTSAPKTVFSRTLTEASWSNTELVAEDLAQVVKEKKEQASGDGMVVMGSGTIVAQLTEAGLVDEYQIVMHPLVLGAGRTLFEGVGADLQLLKSRTFGNGNVVLWYEPAR